MTRFALSLTACLFASLAACATDEAPPVTTSPSTTTAVHLREIPEAVVLYEHGSIAVMADDGTELCRATYAGDSLDADQVRSACGWLDR